MVSELMAEIVEIALNVAGSSLDSILNFSLVHKYFFTYEGTNFSLGRFF